MLLDSSGGSIISGKGVHMHKVVCLGGRFADFISFFLKYPMKMKYFCLSETKLFHFHRIFENWGGGLNEPPLEPPLGPPLTSVHRTKLLFLVHGSQKRDL